MKARVGPKTTTLTLSEGERRALVDVLRIAEKAESVRAEAGNFPTQLGREIPRGNARFAGRVRETLKGASAESLSV